MPANELTEEDSKKHVDIIFDIAKEFHAGIDIHIDENDDPNSRTLHYVAGYCIIIVSCGNYETKVVPTTTLQKPYRATGILPMPKLLAAS